MAEPGSPPLPQLQVPPPAQLPLTGLTIPVTPQPTQPAQLAQLAEPEPTTRFGKLTRKVQVFLGFAGPDRSARKDRRELVKYVTVLLLSSAQLIVIVALTVVGAVRESPAPDHRGQTEFEACTILGAWNLIWLGRLILRCYLASWLYFQKRRVRRARRAARRQAASHLNPAVTAMPPFAVPDDLDVTTFRSHQICPMNLRAFHILLLKLDPFLTLIWFFSTILVIYAHGSSCRVAAKDISAATYTILIILYCHFILANFVPIYRTFRARRMASVPPADKLSRTEVDRIPLVLYIPPPPNEDPSSPITPIPRALTHPPLVPQPASQPPSKKRRFISFHPTSKRRRTQADADVERDAGVMSPVEDADEWDRSFEPAPYPFVRLPDNRATCMICLLEFEAPRRLNGPEKDDHDGRDDTGETHEMMPLPQTEGEGDREITEVRVESPHPMDARAVQLADSESNDAPEPLRLLSCGHVYHRECIDPWLTTKTGQCPYCRAKVVAPPPPRSKKRTWRRGTV